MHIYTNAQSAYFLFDLYMHQRNPLYFLLKFPVARTSENLPVLTADALMNHLPKRLLRKTLLAQLSELGTGMGKRHFLNAPDFATELATIQRKRSIWMFR